MSNEFDELGIAEELMLNTLLDRHFGNALMHKIIAKATERILSDEMLELTADKMHRLCMVLEGKGFTRDHAVQIIAHGEAMQGMFDFASASMQSMSSLANTGAFLSTKEEGSEGVDPVEDK